MENFLLKKHDNNESDEDCDTFEYENEENENSYLIKKETSFNRKINTPAFDDFDILAVQPENKNYLSNIKFFENISKHNNSLKNSKFLSFLKKNLSHLSTLKTIILITYSIACVILFSLHDSKEIEWNQKVISNNTENIFKCSNKLDKVTYMRLQLFGPFIEESDLSKTDKNSGKRININLYSSSLNQISNWKLFLKLPDQETNSILVKNFHLKNSFNFDRIYFRVDTNIKEYISFNFECSKLSNQFKYSVLYSAILLIFVYILIIFELTHRTLAAFLGSIGGISLICLIDTERPSLKTIVTWVEWETILLMFGMMIIVAVFCETGLFDLIAVRIFHYAGTRVWYMIGSLCLLSALLSAFLDNVTTILLLTPITIRLCEVMNLDPRIIIIAEVIFSNIGGASTAIGDPPNVIITANEIINSKGVDFSNFTFHMFVGSIFVYVVCYFHFRILYSDPNNFVKNNESEFDEMKKEITIWTRSFQSITPITKEERIVKTLLKEKVSQLENLLSHKRYMIKQEFKKTLETKSQEMIETYKITNKNLLIKCSIIFLATLVLFFLNPFIKSIYLTIGWISILSAIVLMASSTNQAHNNSENSNSGIDFEGLLHKIEWSTLLFFAGLFIFMKCIEELGLLNFLGNLISEMIKSVDNISDRLVLALLLLIVLSAFISSIIDNIPFTTAMIPIIIQLSDEADLPLQPLVYALAFGSCLGGNGSLIGASCNLVAAGISEQHGYKITFKHFFKVSFPIMLSSIMVTIIYICVSCIYFKWY